MYNNLALIAPQSKRKKASKNVQCKRWPALALKAMGEIAYPRTESASWQGEVRQKVGFVIELSHSDSEKKDS